MASKCYSRTAESAFTLLSNGVIDLEIFGDVMEKKNSTEGRIKYGMIFWLFKVSWSLNYYILRTLHSPSFQIAYFT